MKKTNKKLLMKYLRNAFIGFLIGFIPFFLLKFITNNLLGGTLTFIVIFAYFHIPLATGFFLKYGALLFGLIGLLFGLVYTITSKHKIYFWILSLPFLSIYIVLISISFILSMLLGTDPSGLFE